MARKGSGVVVPGAGTWVTHPLWTASDSEPTARVGRIRWATDQVSTHCLAVLREVEG